MTVEVFFATNREYLEGQNTFTENFSEDGLSNLRFGVATVEFEEGEAPKILNILVETENLLADDKTMLPESKRKYGSLTLFKKLKKSMDDGAETILFVHGFNNSFEGAIITAAKLKKFHGTGAKNREVLAFTWPSQGKLLGYLPDRAAARASGQALASLILKGSKYLETIRLRDSCRQSLHLIAHSMGVYVLREAVQAAAKTFSGSFPKILDQAILVAGDEDDDTFDVEFKLSRFPEMAERISIYFNRKDFALTASDKVKFNPSRLGQSGPARPQNPRAGVYAIDATSIAQIADTLFVSLTDSLKDELMQHGYFLYNGEVIDDMQSVLSGMEQMDIEKNRRYDPAQNRFILVPRG